MRAHHRALPRLVAGLAIATLAACAPVAGVGGQRAPQPLEPQATFIGVGLALEPVTPDGHGARIVDILPDSPAETAGIAPGAILVSVDGWAVAEEPLAAIVEAVRGAEGTPVTLEVRAVGAPRTTRYALTRARIPLPIAFP
jgi:C-terminal processing protease CtpA/Prc